jgi:hypothetical protein
LSGEPNYERQGKELTWPSSALILLGHVRFGDAASKIIAPGAAIQLSGGLVVILGYCAYYIFLDPLGGVSQIC